MGGTATVRLTRKMIDAGRSERGGWNRPQLELIGVAWGAGGYGRVVRAVDAAVGREVPAESYRRFLELRGLRSPRKPRKPRNRKPRAS